MNVSITILDIEKVINKLWLKKTIGLDKFITDFFPLIFEGWLKCLIK